MSYFNLGTFGRRVSTHSGEAQTWCDRGLVWLYGYNHEEAVACFQRSVAADPTCVFAQWGIAYGIGPNYNKPWEFFEPSEKAEALKTAHGALKAGLDAADNADPVERALLAALSERYPTDPEIEDFAPWNDAFADAMRKVHQAHPDDLDVACLFAEAMMNRTPWLLWDLAAGAPAEGASTTEARAVLESAFDSDPAAWDHPGLLHMYIHLMEMSPTPEVALRHGDRLTDLVPDSGHLIHMATHIDVLCGDYQNVVARNNRAAAVDQHFEAKEGAENFYTVYRIHNIHFEMYGAMFLAQPTPALAAAERLRVALPEPVVRYLPQLFEAFIGMKTHVLVRFGMWNSILEEPFAADAELYSYSTALLRYARVIALANLGRIDEGTEELDRFRDAAAQVQEDRYMFNNPCRDVLKVAEAMAEGELAYKSGAVDAGLEHLRRAVTLDDGLLYDEPWGWMQPARHALGALCLEQELFEEAEAVYRADLGLDATLARACQHPRNIWSLHGLHECLVQRGEETEAPHIKLQLDQASARAEVPVRASCYCRQVAA
ncbi:MAG: hypothetical protein AAFR35_12730 [Pseudomonadota bacterium]